MSGGPKAGPALLTTDAGEFALGAGFDTRRTSGMLCSRLSRPWIDSTIGRQIGRHGRIADVGIQTAVGRRGNLHSENILRLRDRAGERNLARRGVGRVDGKTFFLEPLRDSREVGVGGSEAAGEGVGSQPSMILRRRWILLIGEQTREFVAIAQRHRETHRERLRRRCGRAPTMSAASSGWLPSRIVAGPSAAAVRTPPTIRTSPTATTNRRNAPTLPIKYFRILPSDIRK